MLGAIRSEGATAVLVTHDQGEALSLGDQVAVLVKGTIRGEGPPRDLYESPPSREVASLLGEVQYVPGFAQGSTATSCFGTLPLRNTITSRVDLLVRRECLQIVVPESAASGPGSGAEGDVEAIEFFGDQSYARVRLRAHPSRTLLAPIRFGTEVVHGSSVRLHVQGPVVAYPEATDSPTGTTDPPGSGVP